MLSKVSPREKTAGALENRNSKAAAVKDGIIYSSYEDAICLTTRIDKVTARWKMSVRKGCQLFLFDNCMCSVKMGQHIWTEAARLQLVEAVITVEKKMMMDELTNPGQQMGRAQKWYAIARLLPAKLRTESWNSGKQSYNFPKCCSMFHNLAKAYRDRVAGKGDRWNLTEPVCRLFKKREELLNGRGSLPVERRLRAGSAKRINKSNNLALIVQPLLKDVANSFDGQSLSSVPDEDDACSFENTPDEGTHIDLGKRKGNTKVHWTETARLLVIEAVIQVEKEIRNGSSKPVRSSTGRPIGKWERIDALLPPTVCPRGRVWSRPKGKGTYNKFRCERFFDSLLSRYRVWMRRKCRKGRKGLEDHRNLMLTKPVCELLVKLLKARTSSRSQNSLQSAGSPGRVSASVSLSNRDSSRNSDTNQLVELSSDGQSLGTGTEGGSFLSEYSNHSESSSEAPHYDDSNMEDMEQNRITHKNSRERLNADSSLGCPPRSFSLTHCHDNGNRSPNSSLRSASRFEGESKDPDDMCEPSAGPEVRTRAPWQTPEKDVISPTKPPSEPVRASSSVWKSTDWMTEEMDMILDGPQRRLNLEFSRLSSWVRSQSVPMGTQLMDEMSNSASRAGKRRKLNFGRSSTEPFDDLIHESLSRCMDLQIRAAFQKVRVRFAEELKNTCAELSQELQQGSELLPNSPTPSPDISRRRS